MPFAVCRSGVCFFLDKKGPKRPPPPRLESNLSEPARNRVKLILLVAGSMLPLLVAGTAWGSGQ